MKSELSVFLSKDQNSIVIEKGKDSIYLNLAEALSLKDKIRQTIKSSHSPRDPRTRTLGKVIRDLRTGLGYSQADIAAYLGYDSSQFISNWERGIASPPVSEIANLAKFLKADVEIFLNLLIEDEVGVTVAKLHKEYGIEVPKKWKKSSS